jgi:serine/threonine protein kinase
MCCALIAASQMIVHRDLAVRNFLLTSEGGLKVADFGMSRDTHDGNSTKVRACVQACRARCVTDCVCARAVGCRSVAVHGARGYSEESIQARCLARTSGVYADVLRAMTARRLTCGRLAW